MANEELHERGLIALRQAVSAEPSLFQMRRLHFEGVADEGPLEKPIQE